MIITYYILSIKSMFSLSHGRNSVPLNLYPLHKFAFTVTPFTSVPRVAISNNKKPALKRTPSLTSDTDENTAEQTKNIESVTMYGRFTNSSIKTTTIVGLPAIKSYNNKYKSLNKPNHDTVDGATEEYLNHLSAIGRSPLPMGVVKLRGPVNELNLEYIIIQAI